MENFDVSYKTPQGKDTISVDNVTDDMLLISSMMDIDGIKYQEAKVLAETLQKYPTSDLHKKATSVFTTDNTSVAEVTLDNIETYAQGINTDLSKVLSANAIILKMFNTNALFGLAYSIIDSTINTEFSLKYPTKDSNGKKITDKRLKQIKQLIEDYNDSVDMPEVIREAVIGAISEGNYVLHLALDKTKEPLIENYMLNYCYPSYYTDGNDRVLEFDVKKLQTALKKQYPKNKKKKSVYYDNIDAEIKATYPKEVYDGHKNGDSVVKMDSRTTKCLSINTHQRRFGVSLFFRALKSAVVLDNLIKADISYSKSRSKIIIFQKLSDKLMGKDGDRRGFAEQELAHQQAATSLQTASCLYTAPPFVEDLKYITPKYDNSDSVNLMKQYTTQLLSTLGISFLDTESATGTGVTISYNGLLRVINRTAKTLSNILSRFYQTYLTFMGEDASCAPKMRIATAEEMSLEKRIEIAKLIYSTFNGSAETAFSYVGIDVNDEVAKRKDENQNGVYETLTPRATSYTTGNSDSSPSGRPSSKETLDDGKQDYDKDYNQNSRNKSEG